ncbi:GOLPH3/VPS74 family protein [Actinomadura terrae]|uniref:GOLPH3/VPS74 family protein n=1 Tax=Actinomadura terrae TaxID=604353 RepID=UPI001FA7190B|nr:GPP34 family phosphoprotein [Actinomadura terrae]
MRIADELLLLAIHPAGGRPVIGAAKLDLALSGAILAELVLSGRACLEGGRVRPCSPGARTGRAPARDPELDEALARIVESPGVVTDRWVAGLSGAALLLRLRNGLIGQGILAEEEQRILGVLRSSSHPELNPVPRREIVARLDAALASAPVDGLAPNPRTATLLEIAHACDLARILFSAIPDLDGRIAAVTAGGWAGPAVARAIARKQAAVSVPIPAQDAPPGAPPT